MFRRSRLLVVFLSLLGIAPAAAQIGPDAGLTVGQTAVQGGSSGQCLYILSGKLASQACGTGAGTVTSVSVTTANGVSGTVATATTTPAISLTLGAITPTTVAIGAGSAITSSGPGGAMASGAFAAAGPCSAFGTTAGTCAQGGVITAGGPIGSATVAPIITYNAAGQLTTVSSATITPAASSITGGAALTKTDDTNVTLTLGGSPTSALLAATSVTVGWTGTLAASRGGTGISSLGTGVATALGINVGSAGAFVTVNGAGGTPSSLTLTNATGLPVGSGISGLGTGVAAALAVNVGSAGAPVVFNGALGSPSSVGTLPAYTLGGTISGGGNQINNVIIGTSTPLAGSFTTLNASGATIILSNAAPEMRINKAASGADNLLTGQTNGVNRWALDIGDNTAETGSGNTGSNVGVNRYSDAGSYLGTPFKITRSNGAVAMPELASTSAAQTGTLCWVTGTGNITVDTTTTCLLSAGKYKHDIRPLDGNSLSKVMALRPVSYEYNADLAIVGEQIGLLAEDVAAIDDRLVSHDPADGSVRAVRYQQLTAVLAGAIKELKADNDNLRECQASWKCRIFGAR